MLLKTTPSQLHSIINFIQNKVFQHKQQRDAETPKKRQIGPAEYVYFTKSARNLLTANDTKLSNLSGSRVAVSII